MQARVKRPRMDVSTLGTLSTVAFSRARSKFATQRIEVKVGYFTFSIDFTLGA